jgi:hypothetical protein
MRLRYVGMEPAKESIEEELTKEPRVDWPVIEQCCFWCPNKTSTSPLGTSNTLAIIKTGLEMRKLWPPKVKGVKNSKKEPLNTMKADSQTPQKFFVYCFAAIKVER